MNKLFWILLAANLGWGWLQILTGNLACSTFNFLVAAVMIAVRRNSKTLP